MTMPIRPIDYHLTIEPDLDRFAFTGRLTLRAHADQPMETIRLDAAVASGDQTYLRLVGWLGI